MAALSEGTFLIPETGNEASHLYICFQMNWYLCCKYLTIHHSIPTKVSTRFSANSISHWQKEFLLSRILFKQIETIFLGVLFEKEQIIGSGRHIFLLRWSKEAMTELNWPAKNNECYGKFYCRSWMFLLFPMLSLLKLWVVMTKSKGVVFFSVYGFENQTEGH